MIIDCHTHIWDSTVQLGRDFEAASRLGAFGAAGPKSRDTLNASLENHLLASKPVDKSFVLGFRSRMLDSEIPNILVAEVVRKHPTKLVGVAGIDPLEGDPVAEIRRARNDLGLRGVNVSPAAQGFHPSDTRAMAVFSEAAAMRMPVLIHQGVHFSVASRMEFARPYLLDEVAREFPNLKMVIAHLGYPWIDECVVLLGKHPNVFADISGLMHRPWQAYQALLAAYEYGVMDKLLFGSDFPFTSATSCIEALYSINQVAAGTSLPVIPRQLLKGIVERDALALLGLAPPAKVQGSNGTSALLDDHDE